MTKPKTWLEMSADEPEEFDFINKRDIPDKTKSEVSEMMDQLDLWQEIREHIRFGLPNDYFIDKYTINKKPHN